jgi:hypothetical protein
MKDIPEKFVKNCDMVGNNTFTRVKREGNVYIYRRDRMDGTFKSFEVFLAKFIAKGTPLPNGVLEKEDRYQYPGSASFGKTAFDCKTEGDAEQRFEELLEKAKVSQESAEESKRTGKPNKGRKTKAKVKISRPNGKFNMKMLISETGLTQPVLYLIVKQWIADKLVEIVGQTKVEGTKGRPSIIYQSVD